MLLYTVQLRLQVFSLTAAWAHILALIPPVLYIVICFTTTSDTQISIAAMMSAVYSVVMMAVMIGSIVAISSEGVLTPDGVFLVGKFGKQTTCESLEA